MKIMLVLSALRNEYSKFGLTRDPPRTTFIDLGEFCGAGGCGRCGFRSSMERERSMMGHQLRTYLVRELLTCTVSGGGVLVWIVE